MPGRRNLLKHPGARHLVPAVLLLASPIAAHADAGIPMLPFAYPVVLLFLIPVVAIETAYLHRKLHIPWKSTIGSVFKANLVTMVLGFPLSWLLLFLLELGVWLLIWRLDLPEILIVILSAPWLGPVEATWAIPVAFAALLVPSYFVSAWVEGRLLDRPDWLVSESPIRRAVWRANLLSYLFLAIVGSIGLWLAIAKLHI